MLRIGTPEFSLAKDSIVMKLRLFYLDAGRGTVVNKEFGRLGSFCFEGFIWNLKLKLYAASKNTIS